MDKRIITELLLLARQCDHKNMGKRIMCLVHMYDILDSYVTMELETTDSPYEIIQAEANLIWMRTHVHLLKDGIRMGSLGSYENHVNIKYPLATIPICEN